MFIGALKFIHVLCIMTLLSTVLIGALQIKRAEGALMSRPYPILLWASLLALITGTLLVYPKHYTFHTPWIKAAYVLLTAVVISILILKKTTRPLMRGLIYFFLIGCLVLIIHDAVSKSTLLFS